jgi:hypothetical protein
MLAQYHYESSDIDIEQNEPVGRINRPEKILVIFSYALLLSRHLAKNVC